MEYTWNTLNGYADVSQPRPLASPVDLGIELVEDKYEAEEKEEQLRLFFSPESRHVREAGDKIVPSYLYFSSLEKSPKLRGTYCMYQFVTNG